MSAACGADVDRILQAFVPHIAEVHLQGLTQPIIKHLCEKRALMSEQLQNIWVK